MPPGLSPVHLLVIFTVALIVLGPEKCPEAIGKGFRLLGEVRQWIARSSEELHSAVSMQTREATAPGESRLAANPEPPREPSAAVAAPTGAQLVSDTTAVADAVAPCSPPSASENDHAIVHEETHL